MNDDIKSTAKTTETSLQVIEALQELNGGTVEDLSEYLGMSPSTVHRHLVTWRKYKYVIKNGKEYDVGLQFLTVGGYAQRRTPEFSLIKEKVDGLASETGDRAQFIVEEHGERVYLYTEVGDSAVQTGANIGKRGSIHTSAAGKAILAHLSTDEVKEIIQKHGLSASTSNSITDHDELFKELDAIRDLGYAFNREETTRGVHAVGVAVTDADEKVIGALSVSGPAHRLTGNRFNESLPKKVLGAANELELQIEHSVHR